STENMVVFIWEQIKSKIPRPANLYSIKLRETPTIFTEYFGPEGK
ncbi:MAG: 6-carboxytetrahydropterin synthase, partial [Candidatus Marinimicrobia bacterium]|nr:6-carboxytetrahydropterin synthase [Candidatus Neomarinimicrobiota bacterium]